MARDILAHYVGTMWHSVRAITSVHLNTCPHEHCDKMAQYLAQG
jgi:hypothetical protein